MMDEDLSHVRYHDQNEHTRTDLTVKSYKNNYLIGVKNLKISAFPGISSDLTSQSLSPFYSLKSFIYARWIQEFDHLVPWHVSPVLKASTKQIDIGIRTPSIHSNQQNSKQTKRSN